MRRASIFSPVLLALIVVCSLPSVSACAQPRYSFGGRFGGGFVARPAPYCAPQFYGPKRAFIPRGQVFVPPPAVIVPRRPFVPRPWGWGGGGWRGGRRW